MSPTTRVEHVGKRTVLPGDDKGSSLRDATGGEGITVSLCSRREFPASQPKDVGIPWKLYIYILRVCVSDAVSVW